jgi:hypothetical protein
MLQEIRVMVSAYEGPILAVRLRDRRVVVGAG